MAKWTVAELGKSRTSSMNRRRVRELRVGWLIDIYRYNLELDFNYLFYWVSRQM